MKFRSSKTSTLLTALVLVELLFAKSDISPITSDLTTTTTTAPTTTAPASTTASAARKTGAPARAKTGISRRAVSYPDCNDDTTYLYYSKSSQYKTLENDVSWDWDNSKSCNLTHILIPPEPASCGDCDFELIGGAWYRFPVGSLGQIIAFPDGRTCPDVGHCNGYGQISLIPSSLSPAHPSAKYFGVLISNNPNLHQHSCFVGNLEDPAEMVEAFQCPTFTLFQFPKKSWDLLEPEKFCRLDVNGTIVPVPSSICLGDKMQVIQGDRKYFTEEDVVYCSNTQSPSPPASITWTNQDNQDITSLAIKDETLSSLFTEVYSVNSSSFTSVTCQVDDKSHTFYRVSIQTENVTGIAGKEVTASCNFTMDEISSDNEEDLYFIEVVEDSEVFYNSLNISSRGDSWKIEEINTGIYSVSLTKIRTQSEEWKCGIRDPITNVYITVPFTIALTGCVAGEGFASIDSQECEKCRENTFSSSSQNHCEGCSAGEISGKGASRCFQIVTEEKAGSFSRQTRAICSVILPRFSDEIEKNLYMIQEKEDEDVYFKENNITTEYKIDVLKVGAGTYNITLAFKNTSVPDNTRSRTENWKCAVRDPITKIYTTLPFTVTVNKHCKIGTGFASPEATQCTECPENTFSSNDMVDCVECEEGKISHAGSGECRDKPNPGAEFYVIAGVGAALLVILALMIAALIWNKRRQEQQNVVLANPASNENGARQNMNVLSNETKF